jgi:hypothetical protein
VGVRRSDGTEAALTHKMIAHFSMEMGMRIMNSYIRETYQQ